LIICQVFNLGDKFYCIVEYWYHVPWRFVVNLDGREKRQREVKIWVLSKLMGIINKASKPNPFKKNIAKKSFPLIKRIFYDIHHTNFPLIEKTYFSDLAPLFFVAYWYFLSLCICISVCHAKWSSFARNKFLILIHFKSNRRWFNFQSYWSSLWFSICYKMSRMHFWHWSFCTVWPFGRSDIWLIYYGTTYWIL